MTNWSNKLWLRGASLVMNPFSSQCNESGFSMMELIVVMLIISVSIGLALPSMSLFKSQMQVSEDTRILARTLGELRREAIRLRTSVRVEFETGSATWDIGDDGSTDGTLTLGENSEWNENYTDVVFNGLGLLPDLATDTVTIRIENGSVNYSLTINTNGYISL